MNRKTGRGLFGPRFLIAACAALAGLVSSGLTFAQAPAKAPTTAVFSPWQPAPEKLPAWDMALLGKPPATQPATEVPVDGVQAIWIDTLPLQGKPTKAFAYLGLPAKSTGQNEKVPGVVLVHGGGGSAVAAPIVRDILLECQRRDPARSSVNAADRCAPNCNHDHG